MANVLLLLLALLSPAADLIEVEDVEYHDAILRVHAHTCGLEAACPRCGTRSARVHSRYTRTLADLPCCGVPIALTLVVRRFFCDAAACPQRTFAERLPSAAPPYARRTTRLCAALVPIAFTAGGNPGAALTRALQMAVSRPTVLRLIRRTVCGARDSTDARASPQIVGVDDWAWKRGQRYGTMICDLEQRRPLDLLPERDAARTAAWLQQYPGITVVSRDRGGVYAEAAAQGAPQALQVADRWHLLKNLGDALEQFLRRDRVHLLPANCPDAASLDTPAVPIIPPMLPAHVDSGAMMQLVTGSAPPPSGRQERFALVHARRQAGATIRSIAHEFGMARNTVRRYLRATHIPDWQRGTRRTLLDPYRAYLFERWNAGYHNGNQLFREIREQGYRGGASQVGVLVTRLRKRLPSAAPLPPTPRPPSPRTLRCLVARRPDALDEEERVQLQTLLTTYPAVATAYELVQRFARLVRERRAGALEAWLVDAAASGIAELDGFVQGLQRDRAAVKAGLTLEWSQGQVEGQITRLKLLKRQMYGRAQFDLLRQRVLYRTA